MNPMEVPNNAKMPAINLDNIKEVNRHIFRFLDLPGELRNHIYRLLLVDRVCDWVSLNVAFLQPSESQPLLTITTPNAELGTLQSVSAYEADIQTQLYQVCKQIRNEALDLASNAPCTCIIVNINRAGYAKELHQKGYPIAFPGLTPVITKPLASFEIKIGGMSKDDSSDTFVVHVKSAKHLTRAIWVTKGLTSMDIKLEIHDPISKDAMEEQARRITTVIGSLLSIRGAKKAVIVGNMPNMDTIEVSRTALRQLWTSLVETPISGFQEINEIYLKEVRESGKMHCARGDWVAAEEIYRLGIALVSDYIKIDPIATLFRTPAYGDTVDNLTVIASNLGFVLYKISQRFQAHYFLDYAAKLESEAHISNHERAKIYYRRGLVFVTFYQVRSAAKSFLRASELMPNDAVIQAKLEEMRAPLQNIFPDAEDPFKELSQWDIEQGPNIMQLRSQNQGGLVEQMNYLVIGS